MNREIFRLHKNDISLFEYTQLYAAVKADVFLVQLVDRSIKFGCGEMIYILTRVGYFRGA
jgi:hypothetical protein